MTTVHASGGVVWRRAGDGVEVLVVHRPRYDDWTFPKGKLVDGEDPVAGGLREVEEETGLRCAPGPELTGTAYRDHLGRLKLVRYWAMMPVAGAFSPNKEVDEVRWVAPGQAHALLTYDRDRSVLDSLPVPRPTAAVLLIRHAEAGERDRWEGPDRLRPLTEPGHRQARDLVATLAGYTVRRVVSSPYVRCTQTVEPLAAARRLPVETSDDLAEGHGGAALARLDELAGTATALCTHRDVVIEVLEGLAGRGLALPGGYPYEKGSVWVLDRSGDAWVARYLPPPPPA